MKCCNCRVTVTHVYHIRFGRVIFGVAMANAQFSDKVDEIRAAILAQVIRRDYLDQMLENAKLLESAHGSNYPKSISWAIQDLKKGEVRRTRSL